MTPAVTSVIVIEDQRDAVTMIRRSLTNAGCPLDLQVFHDGASALRFLDRQAVGEAPWLIFVGLDLPDFHGFEIIREVRRHANFFVVAMSSSHDPEDIHGAFSVGANAYLEKFPAPADVAQIWQTANGRGVGAGAPCLLRRPA